ncbi:MAG: hypothetical protein ACKV22_29465 [Bryobacteraceae bacterium]
MRLIPVIAGLLAASALAQDLPNGAEVVDRYIEATGGRDAYARIKTYTAVAVVEYAGRPNRGTFHVFQAAPDKSYSIMVLPGMDKVETGTKDGVAWERTQRRGLRLKAGEELAAALREADPQARLNWRKYYRSAECTGVEAVDSINCFRVVMTPMVGKPETRYYDQFSGILLRVTRIVTTQMGEFQSEGRYANYRLVDGISWPHSFNQSLFSQTLMSRIESVTLNSAIPETRFDFPSDVKALLSKPAAPPAK